MGFYPDMKSEVIVTLETRQESVRVYDRSAGHVSAKGEHIVTWGPGGTKGYAAFEITYDALARLVTALAYNPSVIDAMGWEWQEALRDATAHYIKAPASAGGEG